MRKWGPRKAHGIDTHAGKCHESFTFLIAQIRVASLQNAIDLFSHTRQLARIRPNASDVFTRLKLKLRQRHDGRKNTAHQTEKTLNTHFKRVHTLREEKKSL